MPAFPWTPNMTPTQGPTWQETCLRAETVADVESSPGPSTGTVTVWIEETNGFYRFMPGDTTTRDGLYVLTTSGQGPVGRWQALGSGNGQTLYSSRHELWLAPRGSGLDDGGNIASALVTAAARGAVLKLFGAFTINSTAYSHGLLAGIPSHTRLWCAPGTTFTTTLPIGVGTFQNAVPFFAWWTPGSGVENTTLTLASVIGSAVIRVDTDITLGQWVMIGDASVSACEVHRVVSSAPAGADFDLTLDRPCVLANAIGQAVVPLAAIPEDIILDFNGAVLSGTGYQACAFLAARDCHVYGLVVDSSAGSMFDQYNGVQFNDGCYQCTTRDCVVDGLSIAGAFQGPHIANSEACTHYNYRVARLPGLGMSFAGTIRCGAVDTVTDSCTTGIYISSLAGPANNSRENFVTRARCTRGADGISINTGCRDTIVQNAECLNQTAYGLAVYGGSIGTWVDGLVTRGAGSYGVRAETDATIRSWVSDNGTTGHLLCTAASPTRVSVDGFLWGMDSTTLTPYGVVATSTAKIELRNGRSTVDAAGGSATSYAAAACTFLRENVQTYGRGGHYSDAVNSMLIDHAGCDDSACTVANVFGAGAQANYGTYAANGAVAVVTNYRNARVGMVIGLSLNTIGGVPSPNYVSAMVVGTSFSTLATAGDTSTMNWKDLNI